MRNQLRKYAEGRNKSAGTVAREAYERTRKNPGVTVRAHCVAHSSAASQLTPARSAQVGQRSAKPTSAAQYSMQDLDVSSDTDDSFGGACRAAAAGCAPSHA